MEHFLGVDNVHHEWNSALPPTLEIESGDVVNFDVMVAGEGQVWLGASYEDTTFDFNTIYNLNGPILVKGAQPGDSLEMEILELTHGDWGWAAILPGFGLLPEDFPTGCVRTFDLKGRDEVEFAPGVVLPLRPFLGTIGNHPGSPERCLPFPPHRGGGNIDNRHLTAGTTLWLPVHVPGAFFSLGDPHALQGDGEVSVTALEAPLRGTVRFTLHKQRVIPPSFRVGASAVSHLDAAGYHATMGISPDLMECSRMAVRDMIAWLGEHHDLTAEDAYFLCSFVGDLRIIEIVDSGVWTVAMTMPLSIFRERG